MTFSEEQVEWIVAEVLRRLGVAGANARACHGGSDLDVAERVVTMRSIEGRLAGVNAAGRAAASGGDAGGEG